MARKSAWPSKRNRAFSSAKSGKGSKAFDLESIYSRFPQHANAFKLAADMVIDAYDGARRVPHHDELFLPVAYLYRHFLELKLKSLIRVARDQGFFRNDQRRIQRILGRHDLLDLWTQVRKFLEDGWPGGPSGPLDGVENVVKQFHKADPDGQTLRYDRDKAERKLNRPDKLPHFIWLRTLRRTMDGVYRLLDVCETLMRDERCCG